MKNKIKVSRILVLLVCVISVVSLDIAAQEEVLNENELKTQTLGTTAYDVKGKIGDKISEIFPDQNLTQAIAD
ncbi:MAG: hypothetical protein ACK5KR_04420 [Breznakia sp.]